MRDDLRALAGRIDALIDEAPQLDADEFGFRALPLLFDASEAIAQLQAVVDAAQAYETAWRERRSFTEQHTTRSLLFAALGDQQETNE